MSDHVSRRCRLASEPSQAKGAAGEMSFDESRTWRRENNWQTANPSADFPDMFPHDRCMMVAVMAMQQHQQHPV